MAYRNTHNQTRGMDGSVQTVAMQVAKAEICVYVRLL